MFTFNIEQHSYCVSVEDESLYPKLVRLNSRLHFCELLKLVFFMIQLLLPHVKTRMDFITLAKFKHGNLNSKMFNFPVIPWCFNMKSEAGKTRGVI